MPAACLRLALAVLLASPLLCAQDPSILRDAYVNLPYAHASGVHTNPTDSPLTLHSHDIVVTGAPSLRIVFSAVDVGPEDYVEVTSARDGATHRLTQTELTKWENTSAYFNGSVLHVKLVVNAHSQASFTISHLIGGTYAWNTDTICGGSDDRVASTDNRSLRFVSSPQSSGGGCTIWLASPNDCVLTAGHCIGGLMVAEANVPPSTPGGGAQHPPVEFQFTVSSAGAPPAVNGGQGNDYAMRTLNPNNLGQSAANLFGFFDLGFFVPSPNDTIRITGYGSDSGSQNVTNQTHSGPYATTNGNSIRYVVDTTGGNSGSPVIFEATGEAVGIHTHGGCSASGGSNSGTSLTHPNFQTAWANFCGTPEVPVASFTSTAPQIVQGATVQFSDTTTGIPTSWAWDLDGDGSIDSTQRNPSFTYGTAGTFDVTLTATNALGSDTVTLAGYVVASALTPATVPISEDFGSGLPAQGSTGWVLQSSNGFGEIAAGSSGSASPGSGGLALTMASSTGGEFVTNEAVLHVDLSQSSNAVLTYWMKETNDEPHPEDGLFLSDGVTEVLAQSHQDVNDWTEFTVNLNQFASANALALVSDFRIIFRQRDNFGLGTDGHLIDDITLVEDMGFTMTTSGGGVGDLSLAVTGIPAGAQQGFSLFSLQTTAPVGSGPLFGIFPDVTTLQSLTSVAAPGNPLHFVQPFVPGTYPLGVYTVAPGTLASFAGMSADGVVIVTDGASNLLGASNVSRTTF